MHYFWMKKKWFFDIIVSNLLFAFVCLVDHSKTITANIDDIDFADVESFGMQNIVYSQDYDVEMDIDSVVFYPFAFTVEDDHIFMDVEDITFNYVNLLPFDLTADIDLSDMEVFMSKFGSINTLPFTLTADIDLPDMGISTFDFGIVNTATFDLTADINLPDMEVILTEMRLPTTAPFDLTADIDLPDMDVPAIKLESINCSAFDLTADINLPDIDISTFEINVITCADLDFVPVILPKYNINPSLYIIPVIELNVTEIQFYKMDVSAKIELASYVTRFSDLEGLIVEDLTGKKFRDLRNLAMA